MSALDGLVIRFLFASAGCLGAGLAVWGVVSLGRRWLPALAMQRAHWLLGQLGIAATFFALLAPQAQRAQVLPVFEVDVARAALVAPVAAAPHAVPGERMPDSGDTRSLLAWAAWAWLVVYVLGLALTLARLRRGHRSLDRLARLGERLPGQGGTPDIIEVDAPIPPMLVGLFRPRLLLPRALRAGDPLQRELIVAHEVTHWRRGDLRWLMASTVLQALFWFNPAMRMLRARLAWAQELGCDRDVLDGRPVAQRKAYATALAAQLRLQQRAAHTVLAFGARAPDTLAARVELIRSPASHRHALGVRCAALAALALAFAANLALQPALAWSSHPSGLDCTIMLDAASGAVLVEEGDCGVRATPVSTFNIAVSLMGYDSGILRDQHAPALPFREGYADWLPSWRGTTDPASWIGNSTVWYTQQVTSRLGEARLRDYVRRFGYGNGDLTGGLAESWLGSSLQISPREQVDFLRKVARRELPVSAHAYDMTAQLLRLPPFENGWQVHGKTGTASGRLADGREDPQQSYGWFVGWASQGDKTVVFARMVLGARQPGRAAGPRLRDAFLRDLPAKLAAI